MTGLIKAAAGLAAAFFLTGCDRSGFETAPVALKAETGIVTCQLYTVDRVMWDHATDYPEGLTKAEADALCFAEGERRKAEYKAAIKAKKRMGS